MRKSTFFWTCLALIIAGFCLMAVGFAQGINSQLSIEGGRVYTLNENDYVTGEKNLEAFTALKLDIDLAQVELIPSNEDRVEYCLRSINGEDVTLTQNGATLTISHNSRWYQRGWQINLGFIDSNKEYIRIYYDKTRTLDLVDLKVDCGDIIMNNVDAQTIKVNANLGKVTYKGTADTAEFTLDCGDLEGSIKAAKATLNLDLGKARLTQSDIENLDAKMSCGDFEYEGRVGTGTVSQSLGRISFKYADLNNMTLSNDCGNITIDGVIRGNNRIDCNLGSIELSTSLPREDYRYQAKISLGSFSVNGRKEDYNSAGNGEHFLDITNDCGSVSLNFAR